MAEWRSRNYVSDSEDEEEELSSLHTESLPHEDRNVADEEFLDIDAVPLEEEDKDFAQGTSLGVGGSLNICERNNSNTSSQAAEALDEYEGKDIEQHVNLEARNISDNVEKNKNGIGSQDAGAFDHDNDKNQICAYKSTKDSIQPSLPKEPAWEKSADEDDVDELQQDHISTPAKPQLIQETRKTPRGRRIFSDRTSSISIVSSKSLPQSSLSPIPSSPLTPLPMTSPPLTPPPSTPPATFYIEIPKAKPKGPIHNSSGVAQTDVQPSSQQNVNSNTRKDVIIEPEAPVLPRLSTRTFRQRNPIQLHPYALESEQYRQSLKARGLKPLRIIQEENQERGLGDGDLEMRDYHTEEDSQSVQDIENVPNIQSSSPQNIASPPSSQVQQALDLDGDDFPDVDTILRRPLVGTAHQGFKRRKTAHTYSRGKQTLAEQPPPALPISSVAHEQSTSPFSDNDETLFDIAKSPSSIRDSLSPILSNNATSKFRFPPTISSNPVSSPVNLGELRSQPNPEPNPDMELDTDLVQLESETEKASTASRSDNETITHSLRRMQRRLRGVLPASWLKLDFKAQAKGLAKDTESRLRDRETSPPSTATQRGIARPVASRARKVDRHITTSQPIEISDDDTCSSDHETFQQIRKPLPVGGRQDRLNYEISQVDPALDFIDIPEDDRIDAMLPPVKRLLKSSRKPSIRQTRLTDNAKITKVTKDVSRSTKHERDRIRISEQIQGHGRLKHHKSTFRPPRLSILDAISEQGSSKSIAPSIIRVASRTARSRLDAGRHSPSRKCVQLATRQDTLDAQESLSAWRSGSIAPSQHKARASAPSRPPLAATTGNEQQRSQSVSSEQNRIHSKSTQTRHHAVPPSWNVKRAKKIDKIFSPILEKQLAVSKDRERFLGREKPSALVKYVKSNRAHLLSSLHRPGVLRPALIENVSDKSVPSSSTSRSNHVMETNILTDIANSDFLLDKFLGNDDPDPVLPTGWALENRSQPLSEVREGMSQAPSAQRRKRSPRFLNTSAAPFKQNSKLAIPGQDTLEIESGNESVPPQNTVLQGLGQFGTEYTTSFDIAPLPTGTFFAKDTFIGSGDFAKSLVPFARNLDLEVQPKEFTLKDEAFQWGPWTDTVSSQLGCVNEQLMNALQDLHNHGSSPLRSTTGTRKLTFLQESVIEYFTNSISFLDPIDRNSCLQRCLSLTLTLKNEFEQLTVETAHGGLKFLKDDVEKFAMPVYIRSLVQLSCLSRLANNEIVSTAIRAETQDLLQSMIRQALQLTLGRGTSHIFSFLESCSNIEPIRWDDHYQIESIVVVYHVAKSSLDSMAIFRETTENCITVSTPVVYPDARILDRAWKSLFTLLPLFDFDDRGALSSDQRYKYPCEMWPLIKRLVDPALKVYVLNAKGQNVTYNAYVRALFGRCFHLINGWGWSRCENIIGTLFDFFAQNNLAHLQHEESRGSATFLEQLNDDLTIQILKHDLCFHGLLKIIATGLRAMRRVHPPKKIRDIVWRLMPNHGRNHPKDECLRQEDLDALRNHHDLLCVLYWASPSNFRPRLTAIRNLVSLESSHREACHTSIRAWSNLARYQVSTSEPLSVLEEFADWHSNLLRQILKQHQLARTEVEFQVKIAELSGKDAISRDAREQIIARNQRQVEAVLSDALVSLRNVIDTILDLNAAKIIFTPSLSTIIDLFDAQHSRTNTVILQYLDIVSRLSKKFQNGAVSDDSQDFGDWSVFEEDSGNSSEKTAEYLRESLLDPMSRLMSNCFGSDVAVDDVLLQRLVETWVLTAKVAVSQGVRSWNDYLSPYGQNSWVSLRDTEQRRKFTACFLALLIQEDAQVYREHRVILNTYWMESLVERESLLKFQNVLTESVLNRASENPLLVNLPFVSDADGAFHISMPEFRQRRLSLISCILSNMRESLDFSVYHNLSERTAYKREYVELLKAMMTAMKRNYQELGSGSSVRGAYVEFAQRVIGSLQQHTADFCPIDRFFTDSSVFPLPATDPTYVVDRLRSYKLRLQDSRTPKQLSMFIQTVSERAAGDNQQQYLVGQLSTAMFKEPEKGDRTKPTLRSFLIQAIFPAYIEVAFSTSCGWLFAAPVLTAVKKAFSTIIEDLDGTSQASVDAVGRTIAAFLDTVRGSSDLLIVHSGLLEQPHILKTMTLCFTAITTILPVLSYIARLSFPLSPPTVLHTLGYLRSFADFAATSLSAKDDDDIFPEAPGGFDLDDANAAAEPRRDDDALTNTRGFATGQLKEILQRNWVVHDGRYYNSKGSGNMMRREVGVRIGSFEDERITFLETVREFEARLARFPALGVEG